MRAIRWYAGEAGSAIAIRFQEEVRLTLQTLVENPELGALASHGLRRRALRRYPYTVFYRVEPDILRVIAVAHQSRRPDYWLGRT
jgi:plasmid stabilization system protein ParE